MTLDNMKPERGTWGGTHLSWLDLIVGVLGASRALHFHFSGLIVPIPPERRIRPGNYVTAGQSGHWLCELTKPGPSKSGHVHTTRICCSSF